MGHVPVVLVAKQLALNIMRSPRYVAVDDFQPVQ